MLSTLNIRAEHHNSCEDSIFARETGRYVYGCISDGCSTGIKSHFASQLICYAFEKNIGIANDFTGNHVVRAIAHNLNVTRILLDLNELNLLGTLIMFHYWKETKQLRIRVFGDGYYSVNDVEYTIEQDNKPDYLGYHVNETTAKLQCYLDKYPTQIYDNVAKFLITSDGIKSIMRGSLQPPANVNPEVLLFIPPKSENYLTRMWNLIKRDKWHLSDDLSIISYVS